jgi:hypothetical protein
MLFCKKSTQKYTRASALFEARIVLNERNWINTSDNSEWTPEPLNGYFRMKKGKIKFDIIPYNLTKVEESFAQDKIFIREFYRNQVVYECIIDHPYSYNNIRVSCKWASNYSIIYGDNNYHTDLNLRPKN